MSIFTKKESDSIKIEKVENGFCLSVYVEKKDSYGTWDKKVKDLVFTNVDDLVAKIKEVWSS